MHLIIELCTLSTSLGEHKRPLSKTLLCFQTFDWYCICMLVLLLLYMYEGTRACPRHSESRSTQWFCSSCSLLLCCINIRLEHGSNSSFESFACLKKDSSRYCGPSRGPRRGVPGSECPFHQGEMSKGKTKGLENMPSSLLSSQENDRLLELLGRRCVVSEVTLIRRPIIDGHSVPQRILGIEINRV